MLDIDEGNVAMSNDRPQIRKAITTFVAGINLSYRCSVAMNYLHFHLSSFMTVHLMLISNQRGAVNLADR